MNGAEWLARALAGAGTTHVFFVEWCCAARCSHLEDLGVTPILAHSEKAAAYMADGYARIAGGRGYAWRNRSAPPTSRPGCRTRISGAARWSR